MIDLIKPIKRRINRFTISLSIFLPGFFVIACNAEITDPAMKIDLRPDYSQNVAYNRVEEPLPQIIQSRRHGDYRSIEASCAVALGYGEARSESDAGVRGVIETALNRRDSRYYPDTICGVVFQSEQFSFANPNDPNRAKTFEAMRKNTAQIQRIRKIAQETIDRPASERIAKGLHYHAKHAKPHWEASMPTEGVMLIDGHRFYASDRP